MRTVILDNNITNSDWTKANAFDFPEIETVEEFENSFNIPKDEPARSERLAKLAVLPWVRVAPAPVRELLEGFKKQSLVKLLKASFGGDRSEAGRYAANVRWQGQRKGVKAKDIRKELKTYFGATVNDYLKSQGYEDLRQKLITNQGRQGDFQLEMIAEKQGFSGKPKVVTAQEMDELEKQGWTIAYRGVQDFKDEEGLETKGEDLAEEFRTGEYFAGHGTSGNGIYFARDEMVAESYAGNTKAKTLGAITYSVKSDVKNGAVIKVAIPPNVLMSQTDFKNELSKHHSKFFRGYAYEGEWYGDDDIGRNLAAKGVRGVEVTLNFSAGPSVGAKAVIIYDRSMLAVEESKKTK
jgi:hypothetical protein